MPEVCLTVVLGNPQLTSPKVTKLTVCIVKQLNSKINLLVLEIYSITVNYLCKDSSERSGWSNPCTSGSVFWTNCKWSVTWWANFTTANIGQTRRELRIVLSESIRQIMWWLIRTAAPHSPSPLSQLSAGTKNNKPVSAPSGQRPV